MLNHLRIKNEKGFTLIELMIVIAIIGILAAVAIPQFAQYRLRGFNASANSDVKGLASVEAALFEQASVFGLSVAGNPAAPTVVASGAGTVLTGPLTAAAALAMIQAGTNDPTPRPVAMEFPLGRDVQIVASTADGVAGRTHQFFCTAGKHLQGDTYFGMEDASSSTFYAQGPTARNAILIAADVPGVTNGRDFVDAAGAGVAGPAAITPATTWGVR